MRTLLRITVCWTQSQMSVMDMDIQCSDTCQHRRSGRRPHSVEEKTGAQCHPGSHSHQRPKQREIPGH
jgi:hypothetical protein